MPAFFSASLSVYIFLLLSPGYYLHQAVRQSTDNWRTTAFDIRTLRAAKIWKFYIHETFMKSSSLIKANMDHKRANTKKKKILPLLNVVAVATDISLRFSFIGKIMQPLHFIISRSCFKLRLLIWLGRILVCRCISKHLDGGGWRKNNFCMSDVQLCFISLIIYSAVF